MATSSLVKNVQAKENRLKEAQKPQQIQVSKSFQSTRNGQNNFLIASLKHPEDGVVPKLIKKVRSTPVQALVNSCNSAGF